jgi:hypothetical protein
MRSIPPTSLSESEWRSLYDAAFSETERSKLPGRISAARGAILQRAQNGIKNASPAELRALDDALTDLERLAVMLAAGEVA